MRPTHRYCRDSREWLDIDEWARRKALREHNSRPPRAHHLAAPMVVHDMPPMISPVTGDVIGGNRQNREHMARYALYEGGDKGRCNPAPFPSERQHEEQVAQSISNAIDQIEAGYRHSEPTDAVESLVHNARISDPDTQT